MWTLLTGVALGTLLSLQTLWTLLAGVALGTLLALRTSGTLLAGVALGTLLALQALGTLLAGVALGTLLALRALRALLAGVALGALLALRTLGTLLAGVALGTFYIYVSLDIGTILPMVDEIVGTDIVRMGSYGNGFLQTDSAAVEVKHFYNEVLACLSLVLGQGQPLVDDIPSANSRLRHHLESDAQRARRL